MKFYGDFLKRLLWLVIKNWRYIIILMVWGIKLDVFFDFVCFFISWLLVYRLWLWCCNIGIRYIGIFVSCIRCVVVWFSGVLSWVLWLWLLVMIRFMVSFFVLSRIICGGLFCIICMFLISVVFWGNLLSLLWNFFRICFLMFFMMLFSFCVCRFWRCLVLR